MSGWQRIGVVISVLWLIGVPGYLYVETISAGKTIYEQCLEKPAPNLTRAEKHDICMKSSHDMTTGWFGHTLIAGNFDTVALWSVILGPIVILWLVGSIIIATVRWIRRGFATVSDDVVFGRHWRSLWQR